MAKLVIARFIGEDGKETIIDINIDESNFDIKSKQLNVRWNDVKWLAEHDRDTNEIILNITAYGTSNIAVRDFA